MKSRRALSELNQNRVGLVGLLIVIALMVISLRVGAIQSALTSDDFHADFGESGGLMSGDEVRVAGVKVGEVENVGLDGNRVRVTFAASDLRLGGKTTAAIKSDNALGRKFLAITPNGDGASNSIPRERTMSGYSVTDALGSFAQTTGEINLPQVSRSLEALTQVLDQTPTEFRSALKGVGALSETINKRDDALNALFARAQSISGVLEERNQEIVSIMQNGGALFEEIALRRQVISQLLSNVESATTQMNAFVRENSNSIGPALTQLRDVAVLLKQYRGTLDYALANLASYARGLGEAVGSGPFFQAYIQNLTAPTSLAPVLSDIVDGKSK